MNTQQSPARKIITSTLLCFSLAGLIFGFAAGGFLGRSQQPPKSAISTKSPVVHRTPSPAITPSPTVEDIVLGSPNVTRVSSSEVADGATSYTFSAQAVLKGSNQPITVTDVTCRLWLTADTTGTNTALALNNYAILRNIGAWPQPFPSELQGALNFTSPGAQVQPCNANGSTTWTYTLAPGIPPGTYYLYVLSDWKGRHFPWYSSQIQITAH